MINLLSRPRTSAYTDAFFNELDQVLFPDQHPAADSAAGKLASLNMPANRGLMKP
jgi:hypothetical protein